MPNLVLFAKFQETHFSAYINAAACILNIFLNHAVLTLYYN